MAFLVTLVLPWVNAASLFEEISGGGQSSVSSKEKAKKSEWAKALEALKSGSALSGAVTGTGNATTTAAGPAYAAHRFQVAHFSYRIQRKGIMVAGREMPLRLDLQGSKNVGTGKLNYGYMIRPQPPSLTRFANESRSPVFLKIYLRLSAAAGGASASLYMEA